MVLFSCLTLSEKFFFEKISLVPACRVVGFLQRGNWQEQLDDIALLVADRQRDRPLVLEPEEQTATHMATLCVVGSVTA